MQSLYVHNAVKPFLFHDFAPFFGPLIRTLFAMPNSTNTAVTPATACPCGTGLAYGRCCQPFHTGSKLPATAVQLMRSRYCAFALGLDQYLADTVPEEKAHEFAARTVARQKCRWINLEIVKTEAGGLFENTGHVEFIASFIENGRRGTLHENSRFLRQNGKWLYVDGEMLP